MSGTSKQEQNDIESSDGRDMLPGNRFLGRVVACSGARAVIAATAEAGGTDLTELWAVGRLISISTGESRVVALVESMNTGGVSWKEGEDNSFRIEVELLGEVRRKADGTDVFTTGIARYPHLGAIAHRIRTADLKCIYDSSQADTVVVGTLSQDSTIEAAIHIPSMLSKHFAVVGSTGVGKSSTVSLLLRKAIAADPKLRVLILDPHNEFAAAFPSLAAVIDVDSLDLPFWLMRLEEFAEVVFRGRPAIPDELDILRDLIPEAKRLFRNSAESTLRRAQDTKGAAATVDTPVPYRIADLLALIDERIGRLEGRAEKPMLRSLKMRVLAAVNDPRYRFMFSSNTINDIIMETLGTIFRIPGDGLPICVFQLAGIPSEVVNSVASVLCRMAFEIALWSNGGIHMLLLCEEAHRYIPANHQLGFVPTRQAIARIAKEGRKYGISLGIVTQRPEEIDQTILSQCSTLFAMRLANTRDQEIIRSAIPHASLAATNFLSSIDNGEAIAFGEAIPIPMRLRFERLNDAMLPRTHAASVEAADESADSVDLRGVVARMRASGGADLALMQNRQTAQAAVPHAEVAASDPPSGKMVEIEPYRPEMLPLAPAIPSEGARLKPDASVQERLEALRREMHRFDPNKDETTASAGPRRDTPFSLRARLSKNS